MNPFSLGDTVKINSKVLDHASGTVVGFDGDRVIVETKVGSVTARFKIDQQKLTVTAHPPETMVICYHCRALTPKSKAFYLQHFDAYYCENHWVALQEGEPIKLPNYRRGSA